MTDLTVTLRSDPDGVAVRWRWEGASLDAGDPFGQLPSTIAGAPTVELDDDAVVVTDDAGPVPVESWRVLRRTSGPVEVAYVARPVVSAPPPATPPLELRREGSGMSGAAKCFLVLPPDRDDLTFELRCEGPAWVTSLGEVVDGHDTCEGAGLELLGDTYVMCGDLTDGHFRDGEMSVWWLTPPPFDVTAFAARLGTTYELMSRAFDAPAHPYRVFLRASPHPGHAGSAHPASFVMTVNPGDPVDEELLYGTISHELVHEWLSLDGPADEVTWFVEGAADYYSLILPLRAGLLEEASFVREVNLASRLGYASPLRHLSLDDAAALYWTDFRAHRLPYVRGMFYLADLDSRLRAATAATSLDDLVSDVIRSRRAGEQVGIGAWCDRATARLGADEAPVLQEFVFAGSLRPGPGCFGPGFELTLVEVPVLDLGMDASTFITHRVTGLVPGGPADRAGLEDGDVVDLPRYSDAVCSEIGDDLTVRVVREGGPTTTVTLPLDSSTAVVPQWHRAAKERGHRDVGSSG